MVSVLLNGWRIGLNKIALDKLIKERAALPLSVAKNKVDRLLNNELINLTFQTKEEAQGFLEDALALGALGKLIAN